MISREKQLQRDGYYMGLARAVRGPAEGNNPDRVGSKCLGSKVGAVIVRGGEDLEALGDRVISTGYNGTPSGYEPNCLEGGCTRCKRRNENPSYQGQGLDTCICVHAEQNALLAAARFGTTVAGATIYTTYKPCFSCLKESIQAGVVRIVYDKPYTSLDDPDLQEQYDSLVALMQRDGDSTRFERLGGVADDVVLDGEDGSPDAHPTQPGEP